MAVPEYLARESAQGGAPQQMAPAGAFAGATSGAEAQQTGAAIIGVGELLQKRRKEGEAIYADNIATQAEIDWTKKMQDMKNNAGPGAPGFTGNVVKAWDEFEAEQMKNAPMGSTQRLLQGPMNTLRSRILEHATTFEAEERVALQVDNVEKNVDQKVALAALDPTRVMELMGSASAAADTVRGLAPPSKAADLSRRAKEDVMAASLEGQIARGDVSGALARMTEKDKDGNVITAKYLSGHKYVSLLTELQQRQQQVNAFDSKQAENEFKDNLALIEDDKDFRPGFDLKNVAQRLAGGNKDRFDAVYKDLNTQVSGAMWTSSGRMQLRGKSEMERASVLAGLAADPARAPYTGRLPGGTGEGSTALIQADGSPKFTAAAIAGASPVLLGFDDVQNLHAKLAAWNAADLKSMQTDSFGYMAVSNDEVKDKVKAAGAAAKALQDAQASNPKAVPQLEASAKAAFMASIESNLTAQERAGIPFAERSVLSLPGAKQAAAKIMNGDVNQVEPAFAQLAKEYGPYYTKALDAMMSKNLPEMDRLSPIYSEIGENLGAGSNRLMVSALRELKKDPKAFDNVYPSEKESNAAKANLFGDTSVKKFLQATSLNGQGAAYFDNKMKAAEIMSKQYYRESGGQDGVAPTIKTMFKEKYAFLDDSNGRTILVPRTDRQGNKIGEPSMFGYSPLGMKGGTLNDVKYNLENRKEYYGNKPASFFSPDHLAALPSNLSEEAKTKLFNYNLKNNSFWVTTGDRRGVQLFMQLGGPGTAFSVKQASGEPIYHDFDKLAWESYNPHE